MCPRHLHAISSLLSHSTEVRKWKYAGGKVLGYSIVIYKGLDGYTPIKYSILESLNPIRTVTLTSIYYYNFPTLASVLKVASILLNYYIRNGRLSGLKVIQTIRSQKDKTV